ncbi:MAG: response regulator [Treponema sp.]|jgi:class 3 adenylate cyclase/ActR/RegA family two-component response regulator|nr:response regulator [Treponema sp.]
MAYERELIVLVDDNPANLRTGKNVLSGRYNVFTVPSAKKMFDILEKNVPALILLDIDMPVMNGYEAIQILKAKEETCNIPVIFLTGKTDTDNELEGLSLGAIDYITKPFVPPLLLKRIEVHLLVESQKRRLELQQQELKYYNAYLQKAFSTYLSGEVVQDIMTDPSRLQLGGSKRQMTAVFTDIQNFSSLAEELDPEDLVQILNIYLTGLSDSILEQRGTIDKYVGDAIIAFFGAPLEIPDHALRACTAAVLMKRKERELNREFSENGLSPAPLLTRIGVNTGSMVVGNMGSQRKMNYTIMGNAVNISSRLEGLNKMYGTWILVSEDTVRETGDNFLVRRLDRVRLAGIHTPIRVYELIEFSALVTEEQRRTVDIFHEALVYFEKRNWAAAETGFQQALDLTPGDNPSQVFLERCRENILNPPSPDWDGVFELKYK